MDNTLKDRENEKGPSDSLILDVLPNPPNEISDNQFSLRGPLEFESINFSIGNKQKTENILKDVSGRFYPGRMVAIVGPSGAGKSSLIKILSGYRKPGITGEVYISGEKLYREKFKDLICHIHQDVYLLKELTVEETMLFAVRLKNKETDQHTLIVDRILKTLGLTLCKDTYVDKLSGGEKKRLSIGVELITNPPIMFLDEPTSGLDSFTSFQLAEHLKAIIYSRIIVCILHQPSSQILELFDDILILRRGESLFCGPLEKLVPGFNEVGFQCPPYFNRADFAIEIASKGSQEKVNQLIQNAKKDFKEIPLALTNNQKYENDDDNFTANLIKKYDSFTQKHDKVNDWKKFCILFHRSLKLMYRNRQIALFQISFHLLIGFLVGILFYNIGKDASTIFSNWAYIFFSFIFIFISNSISSVLTFPDEKEVFLQEHGNNWYSIHLYFYSKILSKIPLHLIPPTAFVIIVYFMTGQPIETDRFFKFWFMLYLNALLGDMYGIFIGVNFSVQVGVCAAPTLFLPFALFSGFFIRIVDIPVYLRWLSTISYCRISLEAIMLSIYEGRNKIPCSKIYCPYQRTQHLLKDLGMVEGNYWNDVLSLLLWTVIFKIGTLLVIYIKVYKHKYK